MKLSRKLFILLLFGIFIIQMKSSVQKYLDGPIMQQNSKTTLTEIEKPIIYVCNLNQFDFTHARYYGYQYVEDFLTGKIENNSGISTWKGKFGNLSYKEIQNQFFKYGSNPKYTIKSSEFERKDHDMELVEKDIVYLAKYGFCAKVNNYHSLISISASKNSQLIIVDTAKDNRINPIGMENTDIQFGMIKEKKDEKDLYDNNFYELVIASHNSRINDGKTCKTYIEKGTSYATCVETVLRDKFLEVFGCLPPWFQFSSNLTCHESLSHERVNESAIPEIYTEMLRLLNGYELEITKTRCLSPCLTMSSKLVRKSMDVKLNYAMIQIEIRDDVIVYTDVLAYDMLNLVVDLGKYFETYYEMYKFSYL